ncbi:MAG: hypothetical protein OJJ54_13910 [Pseudonocardia sp.]|nr:hypothetical protein [Pseudonocardia sp.]
MTVEGVRRGSLYVFTDPKVRDLIEDHHTTMVAEFAHVESFLAAR